VKVPEPADVARELEQAAVAIRQQGNIALARAHGWHTTAAENPGPGAKNAVADPTGNAAVNGAPKGVALWYIELAQLMDMLKDNSVSTRETIAKITQLADLEDRTEMLRRPGVGYCAGCDHLCTGVGDDRIRSNFCPTHYKRWLRAGKPPRSDFITDLRKAVRQ
jgi:hypothetical protein